MSKSDVSAVVKYFPTINEGFSTTVGAAGITSGGATVPLASVTGLTDATVFVGIVEPGDVNQQVFTGTVDVAGSQITGVKWTRGANVAHAAGKTIVDWDTGTALQMLSAAMRLNFNQDATPSATFLGKIYPIGSLYINASSATNPGTLLGFGTWVAFGTGRTIVGVDTAQTEFDTLGETGGQKDIMAHSHIIPTFGGAAGGSYEVGGGSGQFSTNYDYTPPAPTTTTGTGVNNMNPYITVYMWRRSA